MPSLVCIGCALLPLPDALFPANSPGPYDVPQSVRDRAALLWLFCWLPAMRYALEQRERRRPIPFLPVIGVLYALYYALGPMLGNTNMLPASMNWTLPALDPVWELAPAVDLALLGWTTAMVGYVAAGLFGDARLPSVRRSLRQLQLRTVLSVSLAAVAAGIAVSLGARLVDIPLALRGPATLINMLMHAGLIVLIYLVCRGYFVPWARLLVMALCTTTVFVQLGAGATYPVIYVVFCIFVGLSLGNRRIKAWWYLAAAVAILTFIAIRGAMIEWRQRVWYTDGGYGPVARSTLLASILVREVKERGPLEPVRDGLGIITQRSTNSDLLADVMRRTPRDIPFWDGYTYHSLVGAFVPRVLWPDQPQKTLGQDFGHRYRYLNANDRHTSINLPILVELYINFGEEGVVLGMLVIGAIYRLFERVCNQPGQNIVVSAAGTQLFIPLFVMECDFSLEFGGALMQLTAMAAILYGMLLLQRLVTRRPGPASPVLASIPADLIAPRRARRLYDARPEDGSIPILPLGIERYRRRRASAASASAQATGPQGAHTPRARNPRRTEA